MDDVLTRLLADAAAAEHSCSCSTVCDGYWKRGKVAGCKNLPISADPNPPARPTTSEGADHVI